MPTSSSISVLHPFPDIFEPLGVIAFEHAQFVANQKAGSGRSPHHVGLDVVFFSQKLGGDNTG
jgi:hypothetical protein